MRVTNYVRNPRGLGAVRSFEGRAATVSAQGGPITATLASSAEGGLQLRSAEVPAASPGQPWFALGTIRLGTSTVGDRKVRVVLRFLDAAGVEVGTSAAALSFAAPAGPFQSPAKSGRYRAGRQVMLTPTRMSLEGLASVPGSSTRFVAPAVSDAWLEGYFSLRAVAPADTARVDLSILRDATAEAAAGDTVTVLLPTLTTTSSRRPLEPFDGASGSSYWSGAANASASYRIYTEPALRPIPVMSPVPRVEFEFTDLAPGTETATVYRVTADRTQRVRGAIDVYAAGGFAGVDAEPPFGWPVGPELTYRAQMFDVNGRDLGFSDAAQVTVDFEGTVLQQPVAPSRSVQVIAEQGFAEVIERPFDGELVRPIGRSVPVYLGNGRGGVKGVNMTAITLTNEDASRLESVFGGYGDEQLPVICMRSSHPFALPQPFFALVSPKRVGFDVRNGGEAVVWQMDGDEAAPPVEQIVMAALTYEDLEMTYGTMSQLEAAYLTYFDMESDFELAGSST